MSLHLVIHVFSLYIDGMMRAHTSRRVGCRRRDAYQCTGIAACRSMGGWNEGILKEKIRAACLSSDQLHRLAPFVIIIIIKFEYMYIRRKKKKNFSG